MPETKVNLKEILVNKISGMYVFDDRLSDEEILEFQNKVLEAMKEACRQVLELAAERAKLKIGWEETWSTGGNCYIDDDAEICVEINKDSILKLKK